MNFEKTTQDTSKPSPNADQSQKSPMRTQPASSPGAVRRVSSTLDMRGNDDMPRSGTLSPNNENQWSSAVGPAAASGKSGRVIEKLMAENDRLKRDCELQVLKAQELERSLQTMRPQIEALRTENENLSHANSMDEAILARRDRKIEQLKEEVTTERSRREASEALARKLERQTEETKETARRDVQMAQEEAKHSTTHTSVLEQSFRQLKLEYKQRAETFRKEMDEVKARIRSDTDKIARLDVVNDQLSSQVERSLKIHEDSSEHWDEYRRINEAWKESLNDVANFENGRMRKLSEDMETVTNKMKWVMAVGNTRAGGPP
jgi:chromosome segregation ATPase